MIPRTSIDIRCNAVALALIIAILFICSGIGARIF